VKPLFSLCRPLILASASPRRSAFLAGLGLPVEVRVPPPGAEPIPSRDEEPTAFALRAAQAKAAAVLEACASGGVPEATPLIIAADTIVVLRKRILGKPRDPAEALDMLRSLAGKTHTVTTACALVSARERRLFAAHSRVRLWDCPDALLRAYAAGGEAEDKAGAYAVQGAGAALVQSIAGSWSNVVGLPLAELIRALLAMRAIAVADGKSQEMIGTKRVTS
jgi:septum formation protein